MSRDQFFRKRWAGSTPIGAVDPTVCACAATQALLAGGGALGWSTATGTYGQFVDHPSNLPVSASGMLRSSILQRVDDCGGLDNASQLSLRIKGELADAVDGSKYAGRSPLKTRMDARQLMPRQNIDVRAVAEGDPILHLFSKFYLKYLLTGFKGVCA